MNAKARAFATLLAASIGLAASGPAQAEERCQLVRAASLDLHLDSSGRVNVPMSVEGKSLNLLIDTGGVASMLSESIANSLELKKKMIVGVRIFNFGRVPITSYVTAHDVNLGGLKTPELDFLVMPDKLLPPEIDGILGPDILRAYDDDFDFANARFSLFLPNRCDTAPVYWTKNEYAQIPFGIDRTGHIMFSVNIDGKKFSAIFDTGAWRSVLRLESAEEQFGFDETNASLKVLGSTQTGNAYAYPFKSLVFGGGSPEQGQVSVTNPDLVLEPRTEFGAGGSTLLLGMGIIRQLHLYIDYKQRNMYVTAASAH